MPFLIRSTLVYAIPLMIVALAGVFAERSGIINLALEGIMIFGAFIGAMFVRIMQSAGWFDAAKAAGSWMTLQGYLLLAMLVTAAMGAVFSLLLAFAAINLRADQTIGGTALNMLAPALAITLTWAIQGQGQTTILIPSWARITQETLGIEAKDTLFQQFLFKSLFITTVIAIILFIVAYILLYKTKFGLRLRACGEHPQAADSVGINVYRMRYAGVFISGILGGIGGLAYTLAAGSGFQSQVAGYGFLALAVMIFGNWKPFNILGASLFFALFKIIGYYSSIIPWLPSFDSIKGSEYIYLMLPYIVTMILLVLTSKKSRAPKAEGIPYDKGMR